MGVCNHQVEVLIVYQVETIALVVVLTVVLCWLVVSRHHVMPQCGKRPAHSPAIFTSNKHFQSVTLQQPAASTRANQLFARVQHL